MSDKKELVSKLSFVKACIFYTERVLDRGAVGTLEETMVNQLFRLEEEAKKLEFMLKPKRKTKK